jgi:transcriptional regulator with XRE-family HTH domain
MTSSSVASATVPQTRASVAASVRAHLAVAKISASNMATRIGMSQPAMSRRTNGSLPFDIDELDAISAELGIGVIELMQMPARPMRAGAAGLSSIVNMDDVRKVGPAGIEPTTSTVESGKFAADWVAPVIGIDRKVVGL